MNSSAMKNKYVSLAEREINRKARARARAKKRLEIAFLQKVNVKGNLSETVSDDLVRIYSRVQTISKQRGL